MLRKFFFILFLSIFLNNCGFSPQFSQNNNLNLLIILDKHDGNKDFNNKFNFLLKKYSNSKREVQLKKFNISYKSQLDKRIISKNSSGNESEYQLIAKVEINIINYLDTKSITYTEKFNYKNVDDTFELKNYENTIINYLANSIISKLVKTLSTNFQ